MRWYLNSLRWHKSLQHITLFLILQLVWQPIKAFIKAIAAGGTCCLDVPIALTKRVQAKLVCDLGGIHCIRQILQASKTHHGSTHACKICSQKVGFFHEILLTLFSTLHYTQYRNMTTNVYTATYLLVHCTPPDGTRWQLTCAAIHPTSFHYITVPGSLQWAPGTC